MQSHDQIPTDTEVICLCVQVFVIRVCTYSMHYAVGIDNAISSTRCMIVLSPQSSIWFPWGRVGTYQFEQIFFPCIHMPKYCFLKFYKRSMNKLPNQTSLIITQTSYTPNYSYLITTLCLLAVEFWTQS